MPTKEAKLELREIGRFLLVAGIAMAVLGGLFVVGGALGLGRLPGDLSFGRGRVKVFVPLATSVLLSIVATVVLNLFLRR